MDDVYVFRHTHKCVIKIQLNKITILIQSFSYILLVEVKMRHNIQITNDYNTNLKFTPNVKVKRFVSAN